MRREYEIEEVDTATLKNFFKTFCCGKEYKNKAVPRSEYGTKGGSFKVGNNIAIKSLVA